MTVSPDLRTTDLQLARAHLRIGQYSFARAELETLVVRGQIDREGLGDLAEARWRTGDLAGAGEAAQAHLDAGGDRTSCLVIAAETAMADGRVADARQLADTVLGRPDDLDAIFAGLPRSRVWRAAGGYEEPADAGHEEEPVEAGLSRAGPAPAAAPGLSVPLPAHDEAVDAREPGAARPVAPAPAAETASASAHRLIAFAATALRDDRARAAVELSLVLRSEPSLAPAVLELIARTPADRPTRSGAALEIVRGDAYRLIGRPREAEQAYAQAVTILGGLDGATR